MIEVINPPFCQTAVIGSLSFFNTDNIELMKTFADKEFDLAIVDPPYGLGKRTTDGGGTNSQIKFMDDIRRTNWDDKIPQKEYWEQLFRVSKNQIIWGANHFISRMPIDSSCWVVWDKGTGDNDFADCELAWTSFSCPVRKYFKSWVGANAKEKSEKTRIHPTQKPVQLYKWLLQKYAKEGDKILDTHFGSLSIGIACHDLHFELTASELDKEYYELGKNRLMWHQKQLNLF